MICDCDSDSVDYCSVVPQLCLRDATMELMLVLWDTNVDFAVSSLKCRFLYAVSGIPRCQCP